MTKLTKGFSLKKKTNIIFTYHKKKILLFTLFSSLYANAQIK